MTEMKGIIATEDTEIAEKLKGLNSVLSVAKKPMIIP